jgi:hypothetical protein
VFIARSISISVVYTHSLFYTIDLRRYIGLTTSPQTTDIDRNTTITASRRCSLIGLKTMVTHPIATIATQYATREITILRVTT